MRSLSRPTKWLIYVALNVMFWLAMLIGASVGGGSLVEFPYVAVLFAICTSPLAFVERLNGPFTMLGVAMAVYFMEFGALDVLHIVQPPAEGAPVDGALDRTDLVLWTGALMQIAGFHLAARLTSTRISGLTSTDWRLNVFVPVGLLLWACSATASLYHSLVLQVDNTAHSIQGGFVKIGVWGASGLVLIENYAGPLGIIILAYWWAVRRSRGGGLLILFLCLAQFIIGWVVDTKEVAISAPVIALLTRFIVLGKIPTRWLVGAVVAITLVFPILTTKRVVMTEELQLNRKEALSRTFEILMRTIAESDAIKAGKYEQRSATFIERESVKGNVDLIIRGTAADHAYKMGATFQPLLYVFFPRVLWSDKPSMNSALLLNREFHISADPDTFISPSHLGEWYWNFGIGGVVIGMIFSGALLGYLSVRFDPSAQTSISRILVIIVSLYLLVARSEGQVELQYALWARSMLLIGILHLLLARKPAGQGDGALPTKRGSASPPHGDDVAVYPNLLP